MVWRPPINLFLFSLKIPETKFTHKLLSITSIVSAIILIKSSLCGEPNTHLMNMSNAYNKFRIQSFPDNACW